MSIAHVLHSLSYTPELARLADETVDVTTAMLERPFRYAQAAGAGGVELGRYTKF
jgi:hypothetical protein